MTAVDVHAHVVPLDFPARIAGSVTDAWPGVRRGCGCHATVFMGERKYREIDDRCWDAARRVDDMDAASVAMQALSPMPELLGYWLPAADGAVLCRFLNTAIAGLVAQRPGRFAGLGAVPLQDIGGAIRELEFLVRELGLQGVEVGSNVNGRPIGHPDFLPFFQAAEQLGAAVFVHPLRPAGLERLLGPPIFEQILAFPGEIALAGASLMTAGTLHACPRVRVCLSHGGGTLAALLPRLQAAWTVLEPVTATMQRSPVDLARTLFHDLCVFDAQWARSLLATFGEDQLVIGTDYPFPLRERDPAAFVQSVSDDATIRRKLLRDNALRFLGIAA